MFRMTSFTTAEAVFNKLPMPFPMAGNVSMSPTMPIIIVTGNPTEKTFNCGAMRVIKPIRTFVRNRKTMIGKAVMSAEE
jgi:hypothetical protein